MIIFDILFWVIFVNWKELVEICWFRGDNYLCNFMYIYLSYLNSCDKSRLCVFWVFNKKLLILIGYNLYDLNEKMYIICVFI